MRKGESGVPRKKLLGAKERTNNKLSPHMVLIPRLEPGQHWWEASALTTAPPSLPVKQKVLSKILTRRVPKNAYIFRELGSLVL